MVIKKAVCMHEEDYGILWKHTEYRTDHLETRRSRRLVISFFCTVRHTVTPSHTASIVKLVFPSDKLNWPRN